MHEINYIDLIAKYNAIYQMYELGCWLVKQGGRVIWFIFHKQSVK